MCERESESGESRSTSTQTDIERKQRDDDDATVIQTHTYTYSVDMYRKRERERERWGRGEPSVTLLLLSVFWCEESPSSETIMGDGGGIDAAAEYTPARKPLREAVSARAIYTHVLKRREKKEKRNSTNLANRIETPLVCAPYHHHY